MIMGTEIANIDTSNSFQLNIVWINGNVGKLVYI
jgi:hypothetical protein